MVEDSLREVTGSPGRGPAQEVSGRVPDAENKIIKDITTPLEIGDIIREQCKDEYIQKLWKITRTRGKVQ